MFDKALEHTLKDSNMPIQHRFGKLMVGTIIGFLASMAAERTYDTWYKHISKT